jgi:hypothetical protein
MEDICWAILIPAPHTRVAKLAESEHKKRYRDFPAATPWTVVAGNGEYSAVVEPEEGSEGSDEPLATEASRTLDRDVYLLRFREDAPVVWVYRGGRRVSELDEAPAETAERLGCPLVTQSPDVGPGVLCVVEGATQDEVVAALGDSAEEPWCHTRTTPNGDIIVYSDDGDIGLLAEDVAAALPSAAVYQVLWGPEPERFGVHLLRGSTTVGLLELGATDLPWPTLAEIRGERTRSGLIDKLGIPPELLNPRRR